jgi:DNA-3-methyladenine glycosylase II
MPHVAPFTLIIRPVAPFRLDLTVWALRRRARNAIDRWDGTTYRRVVVIERRPTEIAVRQAGSLTEPRLIVTSVPAPRTAAGRQRVRSIVGCLLGPDVDLTAWYRLAGRDPRLRIVAERFRGVKPPRFPTVFEALVNAFACQQLSLEVGLELLNRLAAACGVAFGPAGDVRYAFPAPREVAVGPPARYHALGFSRQKIRALLTLSRAVERRDVEIETLQGKDDATVCAELLALRGVGRWSAEYVMLRGLRRLHVFPGDDVGAQKKLASWLGRPATLDYAGVRKAVAPWQPYAGMVYFHLLLDGLSKAGALKPSPDAEWTFNERRTTS